MSESTSDLNVPLRLEKGISELQGLHELLLTGDLDPRILADFRDALNESGMPRGLPSNMSSARKLTKVRVACCHC